ncbi:acyltransferase family protein [Vagococcus luciliae]|uniref:O-acetyltransferase OatA n=1 Tax=Vagococcus luciliae TaxID=2920380 RepID=A0ABY5P1K3_9ENTE|nr:acyltransferase family protein [Vagococcus luciliae]UUV99551.1 O-acetyltransferase OatA [Vagococcus luciliae]
MRKRKYIKGIDGLRAIAVIGVILYHLMPQSVSGGFLGVPLFFVISGYLMTDILLFEWESRQKIKIRDFYFRRVKRIYPSLIVLFIVTGSVFAFISRKYLLNFKAIIASSLFNVNNFWQIANGFSYFDRFSNESPFTHLWSLSIEGQFYLFWPIILAILLYKVKDYKKINQFILFITGLSAVLMMAFYTPESINRIYYGTDTRLFSVMLGSSLAFLLRTQEERITSIHFGKKLLVFITGLILIIGSFVLFSDNNAFVYRGGMLLFSVIAMIVLGLIVEIEGFSNALTNPIIRWIGSRSYEIYLWQLPVMVVYTDQLKWDGTNALMHGVIQLVIIGILSELTYRLVSRLRRVGTMKELIGLIESLFKKNIPVLVVLVLFLGTFVYGVAVSPSGKMDSAVALQKKLEQNKQAVEQHNKELSQSSEKKATSTTNTSSSEQKSTTETSDSSETDSPAGLSSVQKEKIAKVSLGAVGDSVLLSAAPELQTYFPKSHIDAEVGRQLVDSQEIFEKLNKNKQLGDVVLVVLGTNGSFKESDIDKMMQQLGNRSVFFVNTLVDRPWQASVNDTLAKAAAKYNNAHLIDWKSYAEGHREWFDEDGIHLVPNGGEYFSELVATEVLKVLPN